MSPIPSRISSLLWAFLLGWAAHAQQNDIPLNRDIYYDIDRNGAALGSTMHTGLRPIIESRADLHNVMGHRRDTIPQYYWITAKLFKEHLVEVREGGFHLTIDPAFRFEVGHEFRGDDSYTKDREYLFNSRGFHLAADLGPTVSFQSSFYENQAELPGYLYRFAQAQGVVPGQGRIKKFNSYGLDFAWATGNVSWSPKPWINLQLGQGRHFVGNGYRSMLLSDNAAPFPYIKASAISANKRFQYSAIFAKLQLAGQANRLPTGESSESLFWWKRATFLHVSANLGRLQLGLFEGTLWKSIGADGALPFNAMQLNPVIGLNSLTNGFHGSNTTLLGLDGKLKLTGKLFAYGQFALTDPQREQYAWQAGMQWFDLFGQELHLLFEFNQATAGAYTRADERMSWTHDNQPLASPRGTNFSEAVLMLDYGMGHRIWFQGELSVEQHVTPLNMGPRTVDLFGTDTPIGTGGEQRRNVYGGLNASWRMNQMSNMQLTLGWAVRELQTGPAATNSSFVYVAFRTGLFNRYYDI
jgi:hypothetical protein